MALALAIVALLLALTALWVDRGYGQKAVDSLDAARSEISRRLDAVEKVTSDWQEAANLAINAENAKLNNRVDGLEEENGNRYREMAGLQDDLALLSERVSKLEPKPARPKRGRK